MNTFVVWVLLIMMNPDRNTATSAVIEDIASERACNLAAVEARKAQVDRIATLCFPVAKVHRP